MINLSFSLSLSLSLSLSPPSPSPSPSSFLFVQISCTFQWYRVSNGSEHVIQGADKASYVVKKHDVGHFLKVVSPLSMMCQSKVQLEKRRDHHVSAGLPCSFLVWIRRRAGVFIRIKHGLEGADVFAGSQVGLPVVRESNEDGQPVIATTAQAVVASSSDGAGAQAAGSDDESMPRLTDWKIEMNPRQEYVDPIRMHYSYAGGAEGNSIIQWFREVRVGFSEKLGRRRYMYPLSKAVWGESLGVEGEYGANLGHGTQTDVRTGKIPFRER